MIGSKFIAIIAAMVAIGAALAVAGLYLYRQGCSRPRQSSRGRWPARTVQARAGRAGSRHPWRGTCRSRKPRRPAPLTPPAEPTSVPTFDVVVIEPSGEGVIAGRAAPGWQVSVQSGGTKVAEATADVQGEWSVVLEKPLPAGDHALSLKITSPDGTRALTSQESVRVAVGTAEKKGTSPAAAMEAAKPQSLPQATAPQTDASAAPAPAQPETARAEPETQALARAEQGASSAPSTGTEESKPAPRKPTLVFKTVDYADTGSGTGTVTITGTSDPGAKISIYYDDKPLAEVRADRDGKWRVAVAKKLGMGQHSFRAERADAAGTGRARRSSPSSARSRSLRSQPRSTASQVAGVEAGQRATPGQASQTTSAATSMSSAAATPCGPSPSAISAAVCATPRFSRITAR